MRIRIVLSGVVAAVFCVLALWFPWFMIWPSRVAPDWPYLDEAARMPSWLSTGVMIFCGVTLFAFGWVAARWNWARTYRESLFAGLGAGLIAGCLIYDFIGALYFGLLGNQKVLGSFHSELTETQGLILIADAVSGTAMQMYLKFLLLVALSSIFGGLGGLASAIDLEDVWGTAPRTPEGWLFRLTAYGLVPTGAVSLIIALAGVIILQESVIDMVVENELNSVSVFPLFITISVYLTGLVMILLPLGLTWGWTVRAWQSAGLWRVLHALWMLGTVYLLIRVLVDFYEYSKILAFIDFEGVNIPFGWLVVFVALLSGFIVGLLSPPILEPNSKYRLSDWLGFGFTQGILGGTQFFAGILAYGLVLSLLTVENIPHLTNSGIVDQSPAQQIFSLSRILAALAEVSIAVHLAGGLMLGGLISLVRKFLKVAPVQKSQEATLSEGV